MIKKLLLCMMIAVPFVVAPPVGAIENDGCQDSGVNLDVSRHAVVLVGDILYSIGGINETDVFESIPGINIVTPAPAFDTGFMNPGRYAVSAAAVGTDIYIFGGQPAPGVYLNEILKLDTTTNVVTTLSATLPTPRANTAAIYDGSKIYVFGGDSAGGNLASIVSFDPATQSVSTLSSTLPSVRNGMAAVWTGTRALLFGGNLGSIHTDEIVSFTPHNGTVTVLAARLGEPLGAAAAAYDPALGRAYIVGGHSTTKGILSSGYRFTNSNDSIVKTLGCTPGRMYFDGEWSNGRMWLTGGMKSGGSNHHDVETYTPALV